MAIPAQALFKLTTPTSPVLLNTASPNAELLKLTTSAKTTTGGACKTLPSNLSMAPTLNNNNPLSVMSSNKNAIRADTGSSPSSASKRNKRKSLEPKKVNTSETEGTNNNTNLIRKLDFDSSSNPASLSVTRFFESSSPSGSQKSDLSVDSGNSSSCCRSPSPEVESPKRHTLAPPKKRFKEDPTLNLVLSDIKDSSDKLPPKHTNSKKVNNPFRPWGNCNNEEEEINDDEEDCFVDVERQTPPPTNIPTSQKSRLRNSRFYEESLSNTSSSLSSLSPPVVNTNILTGPNALPPMPSSGLPPLPIAPQLITANHQQLVQASQNLLTLSKLYPTLVDMNTLASVAAAAQLAASTAAAAAMSTTPIIPNPLQPNMMNQSPPILAQHRPHLADIQQLQSVEPEQDEPLALIKKPSKSERIESSVPINHILAKKMASLKENHRPTMTTSDHFLKTSDASPGKKGSKKSTNAEKVTQQQRNYKNMTRERRVEANARERQRVHTITAAFDTLQSLIPSPEDVENSKSTTSDSPSGGHEEQQVSTLQNQKLSKLSIIKIATAYIMLLSRMAGYDYSEDKSAPSIEDCVKKCSELLTQETKVKRSRDTLLKVEHK